jgi:hypothetical protein
MSRESKTKRVLRHLLSGLELTPMEAYRSYHTMRLGAIIHSLRQKGHNIVNLNPNHEYANYKIEK